MPISLRIDADRCCCSGNCEIAQPDLFLVPDDGGAAIILGPAMDLNRLDDVRAAAEQCPTGAIVLSD